MLRTGKKKKKKKHQKGQQQETKAHTAVNVEAGLDNGLVHQRQGQPGARDSQHPVDVRALRHGSRARGAQVLHHRRNHLQLHLAWEPAHAPRRLQERRDM